MSTPPSPQPVPLFLRNRTDEDFMFSVKCKLPDGQFETISVSSRWTVDQVKSQLFRSIPALYAAPRNEFYLGLDEDDVFTVEFDRFSHYNNTVRSKIKRKETIDIVLFPAQILYMKSYFDRAQGGKRPLRNSRSSIREEKKSQEDDSDSSASEASDIEEASKVTPSSSTDSLSLTKSQETTEEMKSQPLTETSSEPTTAEEEPRTEHAIANGSTEGTLPPRASVHLLLGGQRAKKDLENTLNEISQSSSPEVDSTANADLSTPESNPEPSTEPEMTMSEKRSSWMAPATDSTTGAAPSALLTLSGDSNNRKSNRLSLFGGHRSSSSSALPLSGINPALLSGPAGLSKSSQSLIGGPGIVPVSAVPPRMERISQARMSKEILRESSCYISLTSMIGQSMANPVSQGGQQGWLIKQGDTFKTWNRRWCVMKDGFIVYYKNKASKEPLGWLPLQNCLQVAIDSTKKNGFAIYTPHRVYHLAADSSEERSSWMTALANCVGGTTNSLVADSQALLNTSTPPTKRILSSVSYDNAEKEGFLTKMGGSVKSWKKRWCVLKDLFIYYFQTRKDAKPLGSIPLEGASVEHVDDSTFGKKHLFQIQTRYRTYFLYASDAKEMKDWMEFIARSISSTHAKALKDQQLKLFKKAASAVHLPSGVVATSTNSFALSFEDIVPEKRWIPNPPPVGTSPYAPDKMVAKQIRQVFNIVNHECQDNEESNYFRCIMGKLIDMKAGQGLNLSVSLASTTNSPLPPTMPTQFFVKFNFIGFNYKRTIPCQAEMTIKEALKVLLKRARGTPEDAVNTSANGSNAASTPEGASASSPPASSPPTPATSETTTSLFALKRSDFILKMPGATEYVLDRTTKVGNLAYVRSCLSKSTPIELHMVSRKTLPDNIEDELNKIGLEIVPEDVLLAQVDKKEQRCFCATEVKMPFELKVLCVECIEESFLLKFFEKGELSNVTFYIQCGIYYGGKRISNLMRTEKISNFYWGTNLRSNLDISDIPCEGRLCFTLFGRSGSKDIPIGWANIQIFDYFGTMRSGPHQLRLWRGEKANPVGTCDPCFEENTILLNIEFMKPPLPIAYFAVPAAAGASKIQMPEEDALCARLDKLFSADPLELYSVEDKQLLWQYKNYYGLTRPECLPKILLATPWTNPFEVQEAYRILDEVKILPPIVAFELLDSNFMDTKVRTFAVKCLEKLTDEELVDYLLQLVQVLKYEPYHNNALARFLLQRALRNRLIVGHAFFWHLQAEMHVKQIHHRYGLYMEAYLRGAGEHRLELLKQMELGSNLRLIANIIKETRNNQRTATLHTELTKLLFTSSLHLSLNPKIRVAGLQVNKCKWMDSITVPLWLVFKNVDPEEPPISVIFKAGDDLRQDVLTLQMLGIMDKLWKQEGLDMHITAYGCVATGEEMGMIQVVPNSKTSADIQKMAGGATAAFMKTPLANWLREHNNTDQAYAAAVENFTYSLAGYCVATYVLGIGDRHNDNIMCTSNGHLFHIDFAHFLGNIMTFAGFKRDKAPFVLTPEFAFVVGGEDSPNWQKFVNLCCRAYNILRKHANLFITLFAMMLSTGIPQLRKPEDLHYLRKAFSLNMTDEEATKVFQGLIVESLNTKMTQVNYFFHILAHPD